MVFPISKFENNAAAARGVLDFLDLSRGTPQEFHARPFNHYEPKFSRWWLIPSTDWPACRHSKLSIRKSPEQQMYVGFYTEKGLDGSLASMPGVDAALILQNDWYWHEFLTAAERGDFDEVIETLMQQSACSARLLVEIYAFNHVPTPENAVRPDESQQLVREPSASHFEVADASSVLTTLATLGSCRSIRDVAVWLKEQSALRFFWIDLHIGIQLAYGSETSGTWGAKEMWEKALAPWIFWVR